MSARGPGSRRCGAKWRDAAPSSYVRLHLAALLELATASWTGHGHPPRLTRLRIMVNGGLFDDAHKQPVAEPRRLLRTKLGALGGRDGGIAESVSTRDTSEPACFSYPLFFSSDIPSHRGELADCGRLITRRGTCGRPDTVRRGVHAEHRRHERRAECASTATSAGHGRNLRRWQREGPRAPADPGHPRAGATGRDTASRRQLTTASTPAYCRGHPRHRRQPESGTTATDEPVTPKRESPP